MKRMFRKMRVLIRRMYNYMRFVEQERIKAMKDSGRGWF